VWQKQGGVKEMTLNRNEKKAETLAPRWVLPMQTARRTART
jgi:hypothetical protein